MSDCLQWQCLGISRDEPRIRCAGVSVLQRLRQRQEWMFFAALPKADGLLAVIWWAVLLLRGILPALFAIAMGALVAAVQKGEPLMVPLAVVGVVFVLLQVLTPIHTAIS